MSISSKTKKRRALRKQSAGKQAKRKRAEAGTPKFPIDPAKAGPDSAEKRSSKKS